MGSEKTIEEKCSSWFFTVNFGSEEFKKHKAYMGLAFKAGYNLAQKENAEKIEKLKKALEAYGLVYNFLSSLHNECECDESTGYICGYCHCDISHKEARQVLKKIEE
jgi:hypothetical protein